ncbi:MAG: hypothetical protein ACI30L_07350 [Muribaculaceae bacterium]
MANTAKKHNGLLLHLTHKANHCHKGFDMNIVNPTATAEKHTAYNSISEAIAIASVFKPTPYRLMTAIVITSQPYFLHTAIISLAQLPATPPQYQHLIYFRLRFAHQTMNTP